MEDIRIQRLEKLYNEVIINNSSEIDLNNTYDIYDTLLHKTFSGEFDDLFLSDNLDGLSDEEKRKLLELTRKYDSLCFYGGEFCNWVDSIEGVSLEDTELVASKLLDNYDYLIRLAKNGGTEVLKFLNKFQTSALAKKGAIIALLRNSFCDDDTLESILIEMSKEDGKYKDFSDTQKLILCDYPEGLLYRKNDENKVELVPVDELKKSIIKLFIGDENYQVKDIDSSSFEDIVESIYSDYYGATYKK